MKRTIDTILWPLGGIILGLALGWMILGCSADAEERSSITNYGITVTNPHFRTHKYTSPETLCYHEWVKGPFWIKASITWEEPEYYPPQGLINLEHCVQCGLLRIPKDLRAKRGTHLRDGPAAWTSWTNSIDSKSLTNLLKAGDGLMITNTGSNIIITITNRP